MPMTDLTSPNESNRLIIYYNIFIFVFVSLIFDTFILYGKLSLRCSQNNPKVFIASTPNSNKDNLFE